MGKLLAILLVKAAEGAFGPKVKATYWALAGKKTYIGLVLGVLAFALNEAAKAGVCGQCGSWGAQVAGVLAILTVVVGQVDGAVRAEPPWFEPQGLFARPLPPPKP